MGTERETAKLRLTLELDIGEEPIRGRIEGPSGGGSGFSGWLELIGELERLREPSGEPTEKSSVGSTMRDREWPGRLGHLDGR